MQSEKFDNILKQLQEQRSKKNEGFYSKYYKDEYDNMDPRGVLKSKTTDLMKNKEKALSKQLVNDKTPGLGVNISQGGDQLNSMISNPAQGRMSIVINRELTRQL